MAAYDRSVLDDFDVRDLAIGAAVVVIAIFGYRAVSGSITGGTAAAVPIATVAPKAVILTPTPIPCACGPSEVPAPTPARSTPAPTPAGPWFWVNDRTGSNEGDAEVVAISVTSARFGLLTANTDGGASCAASGKYPSGDRIESSGLGQAIADASGAVRWRFFDAPAEHGRASYLFTCFKGPAQRTVEVLFDIP